MRCWSSLDELADPAVFRARVAAEFPTLAPLLGEASRREVLRLMGASLALAGLGGCDIQPDEAAIPYVTAPEYEVPGKPRYYATATLLNGYAVPVLVETHEGRPTKVEGNPDHPLTRGTTDVFAQAAVLGLYDPDRSAAVTLDGRISSFDACQLALTERARELEANRGRGLAILSGTVTSPTLVRQIGALRRRFPELRRFVHEPVGQQHQHTAARLALGKPLDLHYRLDEAEVVLSLDGDFLGPGPAQLAHAHQWIEARRRKLAGGDVGRLHVLESTPSLTGAKASELSPMSTSEIVNFALALAQQLGLGAPLGIELPLAQRAQLLTVAEELRRAGPRALVVTGDHLPPEIQALGFAINQRLGAFGRTLAVSDPIAAEVESEDNSLAALTAEIRAGAVDTLLILDSDPVYTAPADLEFADTLRSVPLRVHVGPYHDHTAALCQWHVPLAHPFESWSDARAVDGHASVIQPLVRPIHGGRSAHEVLAIFAGEPQATAYDLVRETWRGLLAAEDLESAWTAVLHDGFAEGTAVELRTAPIGELRIPDAEPTIGLEAVIRPDPSVWDGRFANLAWLQELPKPFTKLTWDNVVAVSPQLATERRLENGAMVDISGGERRVRAAVWVLPGQAERTLTLYLGYGQTRLGHIGAGIGYDAYRLRTTAEPWTLRDVVLQAVDQHSELASTQDEGGLAGHHDLVRQITAEELHAGHPVEEEKPRPSLYPEWPKDDYAWGMAIDLDACIGCNACVVACVAENNIPVVGKEQVAMGREMHWLKIDRYYSGPAERPETHWQPRPCMHCEKAPCEVGCPVNATVHGPEGLNQMIYNRCVGTRTCASYCPYKVRRFNFHDYTNLEGPSRAPLRNPDVTVRARGVMEKCTYCVQRISAARIEAKKEGRKIADGEVVTACQQACPTRAITFGDLSDPDSAVAQAKRSPRNYVLLGELNTRPRTSYLAEVKAREPDPEPAAEA